MLLGNRSRQNDLPINDLPIETWKDCKTKIHEIIQDKLKMKEYIEIDRYP